MSELNKKMIQTPDLNEERLETLKKLFPDLFTVEGRLNPDELKKIIDPDLVKETERFEFKWFGKSEAKRNAFTPSKATLVYDEERSVNPEFANGNMIIEGENLETLKCLLSAYREKIKCIYIDPPYNTGKDFVYSDKWAERNGDYWKRIGVTNGSGIKLETNPESSGRFHSNWLNMLYPRLLLARQLLREDGVIFISIDDKEVHNLRKICDEVFGEDNFVTEFVWEKKKKPAFLHKNVGKLTDYIVCYVKNNINSIPFSVEETEEGKKTPINNAGNNISILSFPPNSIHFNMEDQLVEPQDMSEGNIKTRLLDTLEIKDGKNNTKLLLEGEWRYSQQTLEEIINNGDIIHISKIPFRPNRIKKGGEIKKMKNLISPIHYLMNTNEDATNNLRKYFKQNDVFENPKPHQLIKLLCKSVTYNHKDSIILDFFVGSGTTAHAVMELNKEDGGNRTFICVQIPEATDEKSEAYKAGYKKISDITIERNNRVIQNLEKEETKKQPSLFNSDEKPFKTGFKVYKLAKSNFPRIDFAPDPVKTEEENLALLDKYIEEKEAMFLAMIAPNTIFDEVLLKNGFMLNYSKEKEEGFSKNAVYRVKDDFKECLICMDMAIQKETLKELEDFKDKIFICLERGLNTTMKWNLRHLLGDKLIAF